MVESPVAPTTTTEEDLHTKSQRKINLIWEYTQAIIALSAVWAAMGAALWIVAYVDKDRLMAFLFLTNVIMTVVGFYFGRTNHQKVGGVQLGR